jgi:hypothetical protein
VSNAADIIVESDHATLTPPSSHNASISYITISSAVVIDDSQWNTHALQLSNGWNMLRPDQTEAIDKFQVQLMNPLLPMFYNRSIR